jgi:endonuclease YncB( thermonuclease family)
VRPFAAFVAIAGLAAVAAAGVALRDRYVSVDAENSPGTASVPVEVPQQDAGDRAAPLPPVVERVRPVAPEIVAAPPIDRKSLERVGSRQPLSEIGAARAPSEGPPAETILFRPVASGGGTFTSLGYEVVLAGIDPTGPEETCASGGVSWSCGIHARTAFRNWLRGRALTCVVPPSPTGEPEVTRCLLGNQDAAEWLVSNGWAKAEPGGAYVEIEAEARAEKRGMYGPAPVVPVAVDRPAPGSETGAAIEPPPNVAEPVENGSAPFVSEPLPDAFGLSGG